MTKFTVKEFRAAYPNEEACLDRIFTWRYGKLEACPKCQCVAKFRRITTRRCYQCASCYEQFYPTAGTPFEKTRISLQDWFYIIHLFVTTRNGVAAKEIQRQIGCTYKTAWRMGHQIRALMGGDTVDKLKGIIEVDEVYLKSGEPAPILRPSERTKIVNGKLSKYGTAPKTAVFGAVERGGKLIARVTQKTDGPTLRGLIFRLVDKKTHIMSDDSKVYKRLNKAWFKHDTVNHSKYEYVQGDVHTNTIEGAWSHLRRMLYGTHIHVSTKYLQNYLDEYCFRTNHRNEGGAMFETILERMPVVTVTPFSVE